MFKYRTYGKAELAMLYNPYMSVAGARKKLMQWIYHHPTLKDDLLNTGFSENSRSFTPIQVRLIVAALGKP